MGHCIRADFLMNTTPSEKVGTAVRIPARLRVQPEWQIEG